jgi:transposase-like protein
MLTEQEFETFKAQFCNGTTWTATYLEPGGATRWKCNDCGKELQDNLTVSASSIFGPHYKPGYGPNTSIDPSKS